MNEHKLQKLFLKWGKDKDKTQIRITELLNCKFIIGKFGNSDFEDKATNYV